MQQFADIIFNMIFFVDYIWNFIQSVHCKGQLKHQFRKWLGVEHFCGNDLVLIKQPAIPCTNDLKSVSMLYNKQCHKAPMS